MIALDIKPTNWEIEEGELWDDMFDSMVQTWQRDNKTIFDKDFDIDSWSDDFIMLGFNPIALSGFQAVLRHLYKSFGREVVNLIMSYESVGEIASLMLWGEVSDYSKRHNEGAKEVGPGKESTNTSVTVGTGESTQGQGAGATSPPTRADQHRQRDDDEQPGQNLPGSQKPDSAHESLIYPPWLTRLHLLAQEKSIELLFTNRDIMEDSGHSFAQFMDWSSNITAATTPAYHGCAVPRDSFLDIFSSFIADGVQPRGDRRGYYSVTRATYWTNSVQYARIWPIMKSNLRGWRHLENLPQSSILIVVSEPAVADLIGDSSNLKTVMIPQEDIAKAAAVCHSYSPLLTFQQYVTLCRDRRNFERVSHPDFPGIETSDVIIAPLPTHTIRTMANSYLGNAINIQTVITSVSILTAATGKAFDYMNSHIKRIVILGWGEGRIGATEKIDFGTAGIREGETDYPMSGGMA